MRLYLHSDLVIVLKHNGIVVQLVRISRFDGRDAIPI